MSNDTGVQTLGQFQAKSVKLNPLMGLSAVEVLSLLGALLGRPLTAVEERDGSVAFAALMSHSPNPLDMLEDWSRHPSLASLANELRPYFLPGSKASV